MSFLFQIKAVHHFYYPQSHFCWTPPLQLNLAWFDLFTVGAHPPQTWRKGPSTTSCPTRRPSPEASLRTTRPWGRRWADGAKRCSLRRPRCTPADRPTEPPPCSATLADGWWCPTQVRERGIVVAVEVGRGRSGGVDPSASCIMEQQQRTAMLASCLRCVENMGSCHGLASATRSCIYYSLN